MKTWQKNIAPLLLTIAVALIICDLVASPPPERCSICSHQKCHAPCILNLATGEIGELELYQPHFQKVGEIAEEQAEETFSFIYPAGLPGIKVTNPWYIEVTVPMEGNNKNTSSFCKKCRKLLREYEQGYVLIDIYDLQNPAIHKIEDKAIYEIRYYKIVISANWETDTYTIREDGTLQIS